MSHRSVKVRLNKKGEGQMRSNRRQFLVGTAALAGGLASPALAQGAVEVSFFYPIAVGGPITKLIDA